MSNHINLTNNTFSKEILDIHTRQDFRKWLEENSDTKSCCWVIVKLGEPKDDENLWYLDAVEEALCFGWIDSTAKAYDDGRLQRFSPRQKNSPWTELNKERVRRLEKLGLMTNKGRAVLPKMGARSFVIDDDIKSALKSARVWSKFKRFPPLYQKVRAYNISFYKKRNPTAYQKALSHLIDQTKKGKMYGQWNDYGRLTSDD